MASTRHLTFATVKSDDSGTTGGPGPLKNKSRRSTVRALQVQDSATAEVEPARRKAVSVKVDLRCNCSRESAQVECARMHLIE